MAVIRPDPSGPSSVWDEMPQRAVAFGALYFLVQGLMELARARGYSRKSA
jgi:hypothetical protein